MKEDCRRSLLLIFVCLIVVLVVVLTATRPWETIADDQQHQTNTLRRHPTDDEADIVEGAPNSEYDAFHVMKEFIVHHYPGNAIKAFDNLQVLELSNLQINTTLPTEIGAMTKLTKLDLSSSNFQGTLPTELGLLTELQVLDFSSNYLTGILPLEIGQLTNLQYLNTSFNELWGMLPDDAYKNLRNLTALDLSNNKFSGRLPMRWSNWEQLKLLLLRNNQFTQLRLPSKPYGMNLQYIALDGTPKDDDIPASYCTDLPFLDGIRVDCPTHKAMHFFNMIGYICECCICSDKFRE
eukprot:CAMPEP_0194252942 /NCGR_PEP_ID=MMETSP0158-20130606/28785_1 /TAXON_ID=33649 /ORGANISM="Thalassionema nitzschioides, Strain L26-B" /LENGTH=293 /DNA_ID=CAMNT_0038990493 /DNA_START=99 /DNA_END=980 /DNA_ORIENTATION=+